VPVRSGIGVMGMSGLDHWLGDVTIADVISNDWSPIQYHHILASFHASLTCLDAVVWPIIYREPKEKKKESKNSGYYTQNFAYAELRTTEEPIPRGEEPPSNTRPTGFYFFRFPV